jgi:phage I-like protein
MPDMIVQHVESLLVERIKSLAKERQCSVNDVLLNALRNGLGMSAAQEFSESLRDPQALTILSGHWDSEEKVAFQEALQALARTSPTQLAPERIRVDEAPDGAE